QPPARHPSSPVDPPKSVHGRTVTMSKTHPQVWQMAAGEAGRLYSHLFLKHDVMFLGPGSFGNYEAETYRRAVESGGAGSGIAANIASFHDNVQAGDLVLMREGHFVKAVGIVAEGKYEWN